MLTVATVRSRSAVSPIDESFGVTMPLKVSFGVIWTSFLLCCEGFRQTSLKPRTWLAVLPEVRLQRHFSSLSIEVHVQSQSEQIPKSAFLIRFLPLD